MRYHNAFAVKVDYPELAEAILNIAEKKGWKPACSSMESLKDYKWLIFGLIVGKINGDNGQWFETEDVDVKLNASSQFDKVVSELDNCLRKVWSIAGYDARIDGEYLVVGCEKIHFDTVTEIYKKMSDRLITF